MKILGKISTLMVAGMACNAGAATLDNASQTSFLAGLHKNKTLASTVPANGDLNPYAIIVAPVSAGTVQKGDVLVDNFNNSQNLQGAGTTIVDYNPTTGNTSVFAQLPRDLQGCPGGVGLSTAITMLKSGWVIVGSTPSTDGTTGTKGNGCLIVLDPQGKVASVISGPNINAPWGNMAVIDNLTTATLFVSNSGFGLEAPQNDSPVVQQATILRMELSIPAGQVPVVQTQAVIGNGFSEKADSGVFLIGPTGLALGADGTTLYVSDAVNSQIVAIQNATTRADSAGTGRVVTEAGLLRHPLALITTPNGHLLSTNGLNGQVVEIDPISGQQLGGMWIDTDQAQSPPGSGDLFGIALTPSGDGIYYVEDDMNTLVEMTRQ